MARCVIQWRPLQSKTKYIQNGFFPADMLPIALAIEVAPIVLHTSAWPKTLICVFFVHRWPRTWGPHATKSPGIGMCRTASRTMRTEGHCRPRACKTWTCTISNTMVIKESISFSSYSFNLYCIAYCTRPRFTRPGAKPGTRGWTAGRAPRRPQQAPKFDMGMNSIS